MGKPLIDDAGQFRSPDARKAEPCAPTYSANTSIATDRTKTSVPLTAREANPPAPGIDPREPLLALALSTLQTQTRQRVEEGAALAPPENAWEYYEQFMLDEILQLVAERAQAITGASGIAIALAEGEEIICRVSVGPVAPDRGMRLDPKSGFSGACVQTKSVARCDDSENDPRVDLQACRQLGTRSMVAVPLLRLESVVGILEAFSTEAYGLSDDDVRSLNLVAEHILAALKPADGERAVDAAKTSASEFETAKVESLQIRKGPVPDVPVMAAPARTPDSSKDHMAPASNEVPSAGRRLFIPLAVGVVLAGALLIGGLWARFRNNSTRGPAVLSTTRVADSTPPTTQTATEPASSPGAPAPEADMTGQHISGPHEVTAIEHWSSARASVVAIDLQAAVQYDTYRLDSPDRIYLDLHDTKLSAGLKEKTIDVRDGLLGRIRVAQPARGVTRVVLETKGAPNFSIRMEQNPCRLLTEVLSPGTSPTPPR